MQHTYLFYDIETTGLNKCFDQIVEFAAIRTDLSFHPTEEHHIMVKLNPDVIPSPQATMTHRISISESSKGMNELEAIRKIHTIINTPGTISLGYNSLEFDDEFLRFSFYRNLLTPYTHQYQNHCSRMDVYPVTLLYYLFAPDSIKWPIVNGKHTLKLEHLAKFNEITTGRAHAAMSDVKATLGLTKCLSHNQEIWYYATGYFNKHKDSQRIQQLPDAFESEHSTYKEAILIQGRFKHRFNYQLPAICLGTHKHYKNQILWLPLDNEQLPARQIDHIPQATTIVRKRMGEPPMVLPNTKRYLTHLSEERLKISQHNKYWLKNHPDVLHAIADYHRNWTYPTIPNLDPDAALYQIGFPTSQEESLFQHFHQAPLKEKEAIAMRFPTSIRCEQAIRILGRHYPHVLADHAQQQFNEYLINSRLPHNMNNLDYLGNHHRNIPDTLTEIDSLLANKMLDPEQIKLLEELRIYTASS